ncbi:MAG: phosphate--acyl-ACP acyltransferase, partial [Chloroflexi bacterium]|nr:phosphate--acyl-ACP acyltransferase [Chloroflexota bacterium]
MAPRIVLDAVGGDYAPAAAMRGALQAAHDLDVEIILIGPQDQIEAELARQTGSQPAPPNVRLVHAPQIIGMDEHPVAALRSKRDSSIVRGLGLVERGEGDAFVTAGSTGATMAGAVMELKRIPGIDRPAL